MYERNTDITIGPPKTYFDGEPYIESPQLSPPPTIEHRIRAAMLDGHLYQIVYYARKEGASTAAVTIAKKDSRVAIIGSPLFKRMRRKEGVWYFSCCSDPHLIDGVEIKTLIADVVSDNYLNKWRRYAEERGIVMIVLKSIVTDRYTGVSYIGGKNLITGESWAK